MIMEDTTYQIQSTVMHEQLFSTQMSQRLIQSFIPALQKTRSKNSEFKTYGEKDTYLEMIKKNPYHLLVSLGNLNIDISVPRGLCVSKVVTEGVGVKS